MARVINNLGVRVEKGKNKRESSLSSSVTAFTPVYQLIVDVKCINTKSMWRTEQKDNTRLIF